MSAYPPGVSGSEWQIAGAEIETTMTVTCPQCGWENETEVWGDASLLAFDCPGCGAEVEIEPEDLRP